MQCLGHDAPVGRVPEGFHLDGHELSGDHRHSLWAFSLQVCLCWSTSEFRASTRSLMGQTPRHPGCPLLS